MSRLTQMILIMALILVWTASASARQKQFDTKLPSTLSDALDKSAPAKNSGYSRLFRSQRGSNTQPTYKNQQNRPIAKPISNVTPPTARNGRSLLPVSQGSANRPTPSTASPTFAKPLTPFPRAEKAAPTAANTFARPLTPFPRRATLPQANQYSDNLNQSDNLAPGFGTAMTFPAADPGVGDASNGPMTPFINRNANLGGINSQLTSSAMLSRDKSGLGSNDLNNASRNFRDGMEQSTPETSNRSTSVESLPAQVIRTSVIGPEMLIQNATELFEIEITNNSTRTATNIVVQMGVSETLTVTDFDRHAWLDENSRTVSWRIATLESGYKDVIRFRAVSATPGKHEQSIAVGMENTFQGKTSFVANVVPANMTGSSYRPTFKE